MRCGECTIRRRGSTLLGADANAETRPDDQHALLLAWHAANRSCSKRLMPFPPTLIEALERHEHLPITEECRNQLLRMIAATAGPLAAFQRARTLFPFPIVGLDTDNGGEAHQRESGGFLRTRTHHVHAWATPTEE